MYFKIDMDISDISVKLCKTKYHQNNNLCHIVRMWPVSLPFFFPVLNFMADKNPLQWWVLDITLIKTLIPRTWTLQDEILLQHSDVTNSFESFWIKSNHENTACTRHQNGLNNIQPWLHECQVSKILWTFSEPPVPVHAAVVEVIQWNSPSGQGRRAQRHQNASVPSATKTLFKHTTLHQLTLSGHIQSQFFL